MTGCGGAEAEKAPASEGGRYRELELDVHGLGESFFDLGGEFQGEGVEALG
jgi:hypothetical protein